MIIKERIQRADGSIHYKEYLKQQKLGHGGFAECYAVQRISDKKKYALKIISKKILEKPKVRRKMLSEIWAHGRAKHKNICDLEKAFEDDDNVYMLLQLCSNGSMFEMIKRRKGLTIPEAQYFTYQLIDALCYLHSRNIIHRDVKLGNLLIDEKMNLKLADFGLATKLEFAGDRKYTYCGTPNYVAPEIVRFVIGEGNNGHSYEVDVWSVGVILYLMLIGKAPFQTISVDKTYQKIFKGQFSFPEHFKDKSAKDLISKILVTDPSKRYTFEQILDHPFMNPKCGIPKQLPLACCTQVPKFGVFEKYAQDSVKQSARNASLKSCIQHSLTDEEDDFGSSTNQLGEYSDSSKPTKNKLLKKVLSTAPILSRSLKKLANINRTNSPQKTLKQTSLSSTRLNTSREQTSINRFNIKSETQQKQISEKRKEISHVFILQHKQEAVWNYQLSNGYVGTYEPTYKILYNRHDKIYFEIQNDILKILKKNDEAANERLSNRKKFLKSYDSSALECEPYIDKDRLVYLIKIYKVEKQKLILFRLSNNSTQAYDYQKQQHLLITESDLMLIQIKEGVEVSRQCQKKQNYAKSSAALVQIYLKVKKIMAKINARTS